MTIGNKLRQARLPGKMVQSYYSKATRTLQSEFVTVADSRTLHYIGKQWQGDDDPNWRVKVRTGQDATNKYDVTFYHSPSALSYAHVRYLEPNYSGSQYRIIDYRYVSVADLSALTAIDLELRKSVTNEVVGKMYEKLNKETQSINGWAFLGELKETLHGLRHPAESLAKLIGTYGSKVSAAKAVHFKKLRALKYPKVQTKRAMEKYNRKKKRLKTEAKTLFSNLWLEFKFGVEPLAGDIAAAAGAYFDYTEGYQRPAFKVVTARNKGKGSSNSIGYDEFPNGVYTKINTVYNRETKVKLVAVIDLEATFSKRTDASILGSKFDLGLPAVVPALWDLLPLSVFVDYFANVNTVLTAVCTTLPKIISMERRVFEEVKATTSTVCYKWSYPSSELITPEDGYSEISKNHYLREKWALEIPSLTFTTPLGSPIKLGNLAAFLNNVIHN